MELAIKITPLYNYYLKLLEQDTPRWKWLEAKRDERKRLEHIAHDFEKTTDEEVSSIVNKIARELEKNQGGKNDE